MINIEGYKRLTLAVILSGIYELDYDFFGKRWGKNLCGFVNVENERIMKRLWEIEGTIKETIHDKPPVYSRLQFGDKRKYIKTDRYKCDNKECVGCNFEVEAAMC